VRPTCITPTRLALSHGRAQVRAEERIGGRDDHRVGSRDRQTASVGEPRDEPIAGHLGVERSGQISSPNDDRPAVVVADDSDVAREVARAPRPGAEAGLADRSGGALRQRAGLPMPVVMFGLAAAAVALFLRQLRAGAFIYAIGDNPFAARATGLPTRPIVVLEYVLAALIGVFAGIVMAASVNSMPTRVYNSTLVYDVVLVIVLGGIGLSGGRGGVLNVVVGTLLIGTMLNGMTIMDISYSVQNIIKGVVLLIAILIDSILNPRNEETAQQGDI